MPIREDIVASAAKFLQDPSVASSPIENKIAFLQTKNLTQEEVQAALARSSPEGSSQPYPAAPVASPGAQAPPYYGQYPPQYPPYGWQPPPPEVPRRDWRDWFIMATVVGGVSYGLYALGKRYVYPLVSPPTPERLAQDKKSIDDQFEKAFVLVDQLAKDTEALKAAEQQRTERLDTALADLETVISDLKVANRRREDEAQLVRNEVQALRNSIPKAMTAQKDLTEQRLLEVNDELKSLKTLITQRMNPSAAPPSAGSFYRPSSGIAAPATPAAPAENADAQSTAVGSEETKRDYQSYVSNIGRSSPFSPGGSQAKTSIPAWQMAMANKNANASIAAATTAAEAGSSSTQAEASGSS